MPTRQVKRDEKNRNDPISMSAPNAEPHSTLAHDLNGGLGLITGYCQLLRERVKPGTEPARWIETIIDAVKVMATRINGHDCASPGCGAGEGNRDKSKQKSSRKVERRSDR